MQKKIIVYSLTACLLVAGLVLSLLKVFSDAYLWISLYVIIVAMIPFYVRLEMNVWTSRQMVMVATLAAIAAASRIPFASLPNVTPTSFVIIASAFVLGADAGFLIGASAALVSNFVLGQGPWTPWQMFAWGMMGFTAGWLGRSIVFSRWIQAAFCFIWGFLFGWLMNISFIVSFVEGFQFDALVSAGVASFYFDLAHALCNVIFFLVFGQIWMRILTRYQLKYQEPQSTR